MGPRFNVGDLVKRSDATERSIPAFVAARARVIEVNADHTRARVHWVGDGSPDHGFRGPDTIEVCEA